MHRMLLFALFIASPALSQTSTYEVTTTQIEDRKAVFATVESVDTLVARARIGGTVTELMVDEGVAVQRGDVVAMVVNDQLAPQIDSASQQVAAVEAELAQARIDLERAQDLNQRGVIAQAPLDQAQTAVQVLERRVASAQQQREVLIQQEREGEVLAPSGGRVLSVENPLGSVVMPGEPVAVIASDLYLLRLRLPERHARSISVGDTIEVGGAALGGDVASTGVIRQVYPQIADGRVIADAEVEGLGAFFVGERVRAYVTVDTREAIVVPAEYISTRYGNDFVSVQTEAGVQDVVVLRGEDTPAGVEILAGLSVGDVLVMP